MLKDDLARALPRQNITKTGNIFITALDDTQISRTDIAYPDF